MGQINLMGFNHPLIFSFVITKPNNGQVMGTLFFLPQYPKKFVCKSIVGDFFICGENFEVYLLNFHPHLKQKLKAIGHKHIKPPKNCSHKYNLYGINFFVMYGHHILDYFCLF